MNLAESFIELLAFSADSDWPQFRGAMDVRFLKPVYEGERLLDPQQWNMYGYVRNNPLRFIDPSGLYTCEDEKNCTEFEKARQGALKSRDTEVVRAANAYGDLGRDNGVAVNFVDKLKR